MHIFDALETAAVITKKGGEILKKVLEAARANGIK